MAVYVDHLTPVQVGPMKRYGSSCHMVADTIEELRAFAGRLQLRRSWEGYCHYDLSPRRRRLAIAAGAVVVSGREAAMTRRLCAAKIGQSASV